MVQILKRQIRIKRLSKIGSYPQSKRVYENGNDKYPSTQKKKKSDNYNN